MKPYQGILALIGYLVLQILVARFISVEYYEPPLPGVIALFAAGWLLHKKRMLQSQQPGSEGLSAPLLCRDRPRPGPDFQNSDCSWRFEPGAGP